MNQSDASVAATYETIHAHPPGYRARRGRNWFFLGLTYASYYLCRYNLSPVAPELKHDLGLSNSDYGGINTGRDAAYAVGQMVNGLFTDRVGGKLAMTIGAIGTIIFNLAFGLATFSKLGGLSLLWTLIFLRSADGYLQAFGAPGMIKINTAWFRRKERGAFAGIFGAMINLGAIGAGYLAKVLVAGGLYVGSFVLMTWPQINWRYVFIIPPVAVAVIVVLMNLMVKNTPEEAGFRVRHEDDSTDDPNEKVYLIDVLRKIASNPTVWIVAGAYFCTGFVRRAIESWWSVYLEDIWTAGKLSPLYSAFVWGLPITATIGSMASGYISDFVFAGRRAPVAAILYLGQVALTVLACLLPHGHGSAAVAVAVAIGISMMCNSTHSLLGTAAAMDLGGRKMAGCSSGIIDSFQYYGALISGYGLGVLFDFVTHRSHGGGAAGKLHPTIWFGSMLPFGLLGAGLMIYLWIKHHGKDTRGA